MVPLPVIHEAQHAQSRSTWLELHVRGMITPNCPPQYAHLNRDVPFNAENICEEGGDCEGKAYQTEWKENARGILISAKFEDGGGNRPDFADKRGWKIEVNRARPTCESFGLVPAGTPGGRSARLGIFSATIVSGNATLAESNFDARRDGSISFPNRIPGLPAEYLVRVEAYCTLCTAAGDLVQIDHSWDYALTGDSTQIGPALTEEVREDLACE